MVTTNFNLLALLLRRSRWQEMCESADKLIKPVKEIWMVKPPARFVPLVEYIDDKIYM